MTKPTSTGQVQQDCAGPTELTDAELDQISGGDRQQSGNNGAIKFNFDDDRAPEAILTPSGNVIIPGEGGGFVCGLGRSLA